MGKKKMEKATGLTREERVDRAKRRQEILKQIVYKFIVKNSNPDSLGI